MNGFMNALANALANALTPSQKMMPTITTHLARGTAGAALVLLAAPSVHAQNPLASAPPVAAVPAGSPTYARDVAPIFQQKCQECHQPGSIAPMSLLTYADAKDNAAIIRE